MNPFAGPRRARLIGLALLLVTFLVGALAGAAASRVLTAREPAGVQPEQRARGDDRGADMLERLDLTPQQRAAIDSILERRREQMADFWDEHGPQLRSIYDSTRADVHEQLTPEQQELADEIWAERKEHFGKRGKHRKGEWKGDRP